MVRILCTVILTFSGATLFAQTAEQPTLKSILLEQLKTTRSVQDWFVPIDSAIAGLTAEQANWTDGKGNHSIAQLTTHLIYWDERTLMQFKGEKPAAYDGKNDETFEPVTDKTWPEMVKKIDAILAEMEKQVEAADDAKLTKWYSVIAHVGTHNAYHLGQIMYVRKLQGAWDSNRGVK